MPRRSRRSSSPYRLGLVLAGVGSVGGACSPSSPSEATAPTTLPSASATPPLPPATERVRAIFEAYAHAPSTFDRLPHISRFYAEQGKRADDACRAGVGCVADRFACLDALPDGAGTVDAAELVGELPGVSASVRLKLRFGARTSNPTVDVIVEDGDWRVDQVRCPHEDDPR